MKDPGPERFALEASVQPLRAQRENACLLLRARPQWARVLAGAEKRWGAPIPVILAVMWQESRFDAEAKNPASSAYGYAQAINSTWDWYRTEAQYPGARRNDFAAAVDFMGWYMDKTRSMANVRPGDAYAQYLAYHEGQGGYSRGSWRGNEKLQSIAAKVSRQATRYALQLNDCGASARLRA